MIINLERFFSAEGASEDFDYSFDMGDDRFACPVRVVGRVYNKTGIVNVCATAEFVFNTLCARCARDVVYAREISVRHVLVSDSRTFDDDDLYIYVESMQFSLDDLVSEDIYLSLPTRFLCREDCKGLCPMCGADLNETTCDCKKPSDPRWDALRDLNFD